jgi:23S rRNA maturation mini-RNase III
MEAGAMLPVRAAESIRTGMESLIGVVYLEEQPRVHSAIMAGAVLRHAWRGWY